jgi:hypothetical protein
MLAQDGQAHADTLAQPTPEGAQSPAPAKLVAVSDAVATLGQTLLIADLLEVMREEGLDYGRTLETEMFEGRGGAKWQATVSLIYDPARLLSEFNQAMEAELGSEPGLLSEMQAFFAAPTGARALKLELEARRALLDDAVEEAAKIMAEDMAAQNSPRWVAIQKFATTNDLIESNVSGALNANLAFYRGLAEGGAMEDRPTEQDMLASVWSQEEQIRQDTEDWLYPYLTLAYQPLSDAEMNEYQTFSETPAGQRLNAALFYAFNKIFDQVSYDLGRAASRQMQGEDI